ncbi:MAG: phosphoribosylanthranilate isomerase [Pyrinomonadaceae bacterium]
MTRVKICGITNIEDARHAYESGADELGFNFYAKSSRYLSLDVAREIINSLPAKLSKVGVFVNMSIEGVLETVNMTGINAVQLHGDENGEYVKELRRRLDLKIIRAFRIRETKEIVSSALSNHPVFGAHAILFDSWSPTEFGGTGKIFAWDIANKMAENFPIFYLAGGLTPGNVAEAVRTVKPYAVDVASGVESSPGKKDPEKVAAFIKAAKEAI